MGEHQCEALKALADVMDKYDIIFNSCEIHGEEYDLKIKGQNVDYDYMRLDAHLIKEHLKEQES